MGSEPVAHRIPGGGIGVRCIVAKALKGGQFLLVGRNGGGRRIGGTIGACYGVRRSLVGGCEVGVVGSGCDIG